MVNLLTESFETDGNGARYTTSIPELTDGSGDFYTRTDGTNITGTYNVTGADGGFYFALMDTDGDAGGAAIITMTFAAIDITGYENLSFSGLFAEDDATDGLEDWDANVSLQIEYSIDGGAFQDLLSFESTGGTNTGPAQDTDFDGVGDGTALTSAFSLFSAGIIGTGASLVLRVTARNFTAGDEDIAFDNFQVDGDLAMNAAPVTADLEAAAISYVEHGGAQNISGALTLTDADDTDLEGATITISAGLDTANDSLVFVDQNGITGVYTAATGILVLTGTASVANYQAAIRSITYDNAFTTESTTQRTISITVNDGDDDSAIVTRNIDFVVDETIVGTPAADTIFGGFGTDVITGLASNDRLFGDDGDDMLNGGDGNDILTGGAGADTLIGGAGTDRAYYISSSSGVWLDITTGGTMGDADGDTYDSIEQIFGSSFNDEMTGGAGDDQFFGRGGMDMLTGNDGNDRLFGHAGDDMISGGAGIDSIYGGDGDDTLYGGADDDLMYGGAGMDHVQGDGGNDRMFGQGDDDMMFGNDGDDLIYGGDGDDTLSGGLGVDRLFGDAGMDSITGEDGDDFLFGGAGTDTLSGGAGNDSLFGGEGDDTLEGGAGIDRAMYTTASAGVSANLFDSFGNTGEAAGDLYTSIENLYGSQFDDTLTGDDNDNVISGLNGADIINGGAGNDRLIGGNGNDTLSGDAGDDILISQTGDDMLFGGGGADRLIAGDGADRLEGGAGNDILLGQAGADVYVYQGVASGDDTIVGFAQGEDLIEFNDGPTSFAELTIEQIGAHVKITWATGTALATYSVAGDFTAIDFVFNVVAELPAEDKNNVAEDLDVVFTNDQNMVAEFLNEVTDPSINQAEISEFAMDMGAYIFDGFIL